MICKPVSALSNHITFEGRALLKIICEPCFVDYQFAKQAIWRGQFPREGIILSAIIDVNSCMCNKFLFVLFRFVSFRFVSRNTISPKKWLQRRPAAVTRPAKE